MTRTRWVAPAIAFILAVSSSNNAGAAEEIVERRLQPARCLCGVVTYLNGDPVPNAKIEEFDQDWKASIRSVPTDQEVRFTLAPVAKQQIYYLQVTASSPGINPLRVPIRLQRWRGTKLLRLRLELA